MKVDELWGTDTVHSSHLAPDVVWTWHPGPVAWLTSHWHELIMMSILQLMWSISNSFKNSIHEVTISHSFEYLKKYCIYLYLKCLCEVSSQRKALWLRSPWPRKGAAWQNCEGMWRDVKGKAEVEQSQSLSEVRIDHAMQYMFLTPWWLCVAFHRHDVVPAEIPNLGI